MTYDDDFLSATADALSDMRVLVEGAIIIFENDTTPIIRLCTQHQEYEARTAFNDIGGALYRVRSQIQKLQTAVREESERLHAARKEKHDD